MKISEVKTKVINKKIIALSLFIALFVAVSASLLLTFKGSSKEETSRLALEKKKRTDLERYTKDFSNAFSGIDYKHLISFYDEVSYDAKFFMDNGWDLTSLTCKSKCNLIFTKLNSERFSYIDMYKKGQVIKPKFSSNSLEYDSVDYFSEFWDNKVRSIHNDTPPELETCQSKISGLYRLSDTYKEYALVDVGLPDYVTSVSGYSWAKNSKVKQGTVSLTLNKLDDIYLIGYFMKKKELLSDFSYSNGQVRLELNFYCY